MTTTLQNISPELFRRLDMVGQSMTGLTTSVTINGGSEASAYNDPISSYLTNPMEVSQFVPQMADITPAANTIEAQSFSLNKMPAVSFSLTGEQQKSLENSYGASSVIATQFQQAVEAIVMEIENDIASEVMSNAYVAYSVTGTPFANKTLDDLNGFREIMEFQGKTPFNQGLCSFVMGGPTTTSMRNITQLQRVNEAADQGLLRQGELSNLSGFSCKSTSAALRHLACGTGTAATGYTVNVAAAVGDNEIVVNIGSSDLVAGDLIQFPNDANWYVVNGYDAATATVKLSRPGIQVAQASGATITVHATYTASVGLHQRAVELACRPIHIPSGGDKATDRTQVIDPRTGLAFDVAYYPGTGMGAYSVKCLFATRVWKGDFVGLLAAA